MSTPKVRPILMSAPMVRALLDGSKTHTRRIVKPQPSEKLYKESHPITKSVYAALFDGKRIPCPYGQPGDRLWVRETFANGILDYGFVYAADRGDVAQRRIVNKWTSPIHMPRWASRITLEIINVRVERLNDCSEKDARSEGCITEEIISGYDNKPIQVPKEIPYESGGWIGWDNCRDWYADLWESINGLGSWDANPWVWVIEFKRISQ